MRATESHGEGVAPGVGLVHFQEHEARRIGGLGGAGDDVPGRSSEHRQGQPLQISLQMPFEGGAAVEMPHAIGRDGRHALIFRMPLVAAAQRQHAVLAQRLGRGHEFQVDAIGAAVADVRLVGEEHGARLLHVLHHPQPQGLRNGQLARQRRNPAGANARDARRAGSGCRPGRRPRTSSTIRRRRSACPEQRQQAVRPEAALPARYAGDVHLFVAGAGRRCQRRGRHASRQAQAAACRGASVEDETSCCCWARWRRWSSSIAARRGTLPSEARCSSIRRRMPARCSSTTRTSSRPANFWSSTTRSRSGSARRRPARW